MNQELTQSYLKSILDYNHEAGIFTWKVSNNRKIRIGDVAGCVYNGYIRIKINNKKYQAHRLAWLYVHGKFPPEQIDHINHNRADNRIANLRSVSHQENHRNQSKTNNNTSGFVGINWHKQRNKWRAFITVDQKHIYLGLFTDINDAISARKQAEIDYNFHNNHGV